ncbi:MAG: lysylphosphatidylglycerol synthase transmembrane domain-containing protein [Bacteroidota bacterium]
MTPRARTLLKYLVSALLTIGLLYFAFRDTDFDKVYLAIKGANYWWMLAMFAVLMTSHFFRAWRWRYLLNPIKPGISLRNLFSGVMIGYFVNNLLPRAGELVRPYTIGKLESIPKSAALGTIVVERIMDTASVLVLVTIIPLVYDGPLLLAFPWLQRTGIIVSCITFGFLLFVLVLMMRRDWTDALLRRVEALLPSSLGARLDKITHSFLDGFLVVKRPGSFLAILVLSTLVWLLYVVMAYLAFFAFGLEGHLGFGSAVVVLAISSIGMAIPTPGSTGGYHWFAAQTLIRLFHIPNEVALGYATLTHAVGFIGVTVIGLYFFLRDNVTITEAINKPVEQAT